MKKLQDQLEEQLEQQQKLEIKVNEQDKVRQSIADLEARVEAEKTLEQ